MKCRGGEINLPCGILLMKRLLKTKKGVRKMRKERYLGESAYLKRPELGYRYVEIVGFEGNKLIVKTTSGYEFVIYEDELEDDD
jgi:membrane protein implicated in regulation of membrane protease activity